jgi:hypothetical protein
MTAGQDVQVDKRSHVHDSITSGRRVDVKRDAWVGGDITAVDRVTVDSSATVTGTITEYTTIPLIPDSSWVELLLTPGTEDVTVPRNGDLTLAPGDYRDLHAKRGATLTLLSGQYVFRTFKADQDARIELDFSAGTIVVDVAGMLLLKQDVNMAIVGSSGAGPEGIMFRVAHQEPSGAGAAVHLHKGGDYLGTFLAPYALVYLGDDTTLTGALYGQKVSVGQRAQVTGLPARDLFASLFVD